MSPTITNGFTLEKESGEGKFFNTGDDAIQVMQLKGSWHEMGKQYGTFGKEGLELMWAISVQPFLDNGWTTEEEAYSKFGRPVYEDTSTRVKELMRGIADATGWSIEKVSFCSVSAIHARYQSKLHSFSGCSTLMAWGSASKDGHMITARNMDWGEAFNKLPTYLVVFNPTESGSNKVANFGWPGWLFITTAINDKGIYMDLHDGSSMGGDMVFMDRACMPHNTFDWMVESSDVESISRRFNASNNMLSLIYSVAGPTHAFSVEAPVFDNRRKDPEDNKNYHIVVNSFMVKDWGIQKRETMSNSLRRYSNLDALAENNMGKIDAAKAMEIFDMRLFNEDGTLKEGGGATKPTKQDADLTNHQMVTDFQNKKVYLKCPLKTDWREVDLGAVFD